MKKTFAGIMGIIFIVLGVIGFIAILASFDWGEWSRIQELETTYAAEIAIMKEQRDSTYIIAFTALLGNLAIGSVLLALDNIIGLLKKER